VATHSGRKVSINLAAGAVTPRFHLDCAPLPGALYTYDNDLGEEIALLADISISVAGAYVVQTDVRILVGNAAVLLADLLLTITRPVSPHTKVSGSVTSPALEFLGKGLKFPFTFQKRSGGAQISTATSSDHAHIHESIRQILGTRKGERFMRPDFGSRLHELVFEPNDQILYGLIRHEVMDALDTWEPRVIITEVVVVSDSVNEHLVLIEVRYRLISSQVEGNCVVPFWRELE